MVKAIFISLLLFWVVVRVELGGEMKSGGKRESGNVYMKLGDWKVRGFGRLDA